MQPIAMLVCKRAIFFEILLPGMAGVFLSGIAWGMLRLTFMLIESALFARQASKLAIYSINYYKLQRHTKLVRFGSFFRAFVLGTLGAHYVSPYTGAH